MLIYNTQREIDEVTTLKKLVGNIINPNGDIPESRDMKPYLEAVRKADGLVCSEVDGHIGKGVFSEVATALAEKQHVYVLRNKKLAPILGLEVVNPRDWKLSYGRLIAN